MGWEKKVISTAVGLWLWGREEVPRRDEWSFCLNAKQLRFESVRHP